MNYHNLPTVCLEQLTISSHCFQSFATWHHNPYCSQTM